ncbi:MAG TPA: hypothetical protein VG966_12910 [Hyphomicrobiaceae bacterium]|nr:hypothetical protein [Hyphomicrobiaceae bacterium]
MTNSQSKEEAEFTRILELALRAKAAEAQQAEERRHDWAHAVDSQIQSALEELLSSPAYVPIGRLAQLYGDGEEGSAAGPERARDLDQFLAEELQLNPDLTADELRRLRRQFAIYNHPDRVMASERDRATRRMALVNVLIDRALREKRAQAASAKR